jgi:hypothetical protein
LSGSRTGKSRHGSEFASSIQEAIKLNIQHPLYCELAQRLKTAFVFNVSFENRMSLATEETSAWKAIGARMLHQLLREPFDVVLHKYDAEPDAIFWLTARAENIDLYDDFTGILVVDRIHAALERVNDRKNKDSYFYRFLNQIGNLSLMSRNLSRSEGGNMRQTPFIMTYVTATCFGPADQILATSYRKHVYLPLNQLKPPVSKNDNLPVLNDTPGICLLMNDVDGHARAIEVITEELAEHQNLDQLNITQLAASIFSKLASHYKTAVSMIRGYIFPLA